MATGDEGWPFSTGRATGEVEWEQLQRTLSDDGVIGSPGSQVAQVYGDGSGMQVKRRAGEAWFRGGYWRNLQETVIPIDPNSSTTQSRIDRIVLRLDWGSDSITTEKKVGTAAAVPTPPALTQTPGVLWELPLAQVTVGPGVGVAGSGKAQTIAASAVTSDDRTWRSLRLWVVTNLTQLPKTGVPLWQEAVDASGAKVRWDGNAWRQLATGGDIYVASYTPQVFHTGLNRNIAVNAPASGGWYQVDNGKVFGQMVFASAESSTVTGDWHPVMPVAGRSLALAPLGTFMFNPVSDANYYEAGSLIFRVGDPTHASTYSANRNYASGTQGVFHAAPKQGDVMSWSFTGYLTA